MSSIVLPPSTAYFECFQAFHFPTVRVPVGFGHIVKLFHGRYFADWEKESDPDRRLYISPDFRNKVMSTFEPVVVSDLPEQQTVYCWRAPKPVPWSTLYTDFPQHGVAASKHQVAPWIRLQSLVFGGHRFSAPVVPKNDRGAVLYLGDAGVTKTDPSGATTKGTKRWLVQISHFSMIGQAVWTMGLAQKENDSSECPKDLVLLTFT